MKLIHTLLLLAILGFLIGNSYLTYQQTEELKRAINIQGASAVANYQYARECAKFNRIYGIQ